MYIIFFYIQSGNKDEKHGDERQDQIQWLHSVSVYEKQEKENCDSRGDSQDGSGHAAPFQTDGEKFVHHSCQDQAHDLDYYDNKGDPAYSPYK